MFDNFKPTYKATALDTCLNMKKHMARHAYLLFPYEPTTFFSIFLSI